ncbi:MAG: hypothetical protein JST12_02775 [Armatimonadetes bacterium]|nr:hypothetical protein [Armatimonadota bacterium]
MTFALAAILLSASQVDNLSAFAAGFAEKAGTLTANGGLPGIVMAFGPDAEVLAVAKDGKTTKPIIAAATYGKGRVAILGHGSILAKPGNEAMSRTLFAWVHQSSKPIGLFTNIPLSPAFGEPKTYRSKSSIPAAIRECGTLVFDQDLGDGDPKVEEMLDQYVRDGGGLVLAGPAWGWLQLHPGQELWKDHGGQRLLAKMGLGFADGTIDPVKGQIDLYPAKPAQQVGRAMAMVRSKRMLSPEEAKLVGETLETAMGALAPDNPIQKQLESMLNTDQNDIRPTKEKPLTASQFQLRLAAQYYDKMWRQLPPEKVTAHPAAQDFPGPVTTTERTDMEVRIGGKKRRWWSTGAYAAPGEVVTVRLPQELRGLGIRLRIGGHRDTLWHLDKWERFPSITLEVPIRNGVGKAANPFGGLVYLVCDKVIPTGTVEIEHVVQAPVYFLGQTSASEWKKIRTSGAPWGEVVANNCVVCVPSSVLKTLDDPKPVAEYWDEVVQQVEFLYSVPEGTNEERYQVDRQISAGYMHSGYPIMTWEDVSAKFVDISILRGNDGDKNWGFYHEIGHNFQRPSWTWSGWGETTNNLYSLYGGEHFNHDMSGGHGAMKVDKREERMKTVLANPGKEEYFDMDPWYGLTFLRAIREEFGWKPFQTLFAEFRDLPRDQQPKSELEKHDQFLVRMSTILKRDLSRYLTAWGVPLSDDAKAKCHQYPEWMPKV